MTLSYKDMALRLLSFNLISKFSLPNTIFTVRCRCKVSNSAFKPPPQISARPRLRLYFTSINRDLQSPKKAGKSPKYSYDINIDVPNNVLLYSDGDRHHLFGLIQVLSIGAFLIFMLIGDTIRQVLAKLKKTPLPEGEQIKWYQWWKRLRPEGKKVGYFLFFVLSAVGKCFQNLNGLLMTRQTDNTSPGECARREIRHWLSQEMQTWTHSHQTFQHR